jgi:hypothetical protein
LLAGVRVELVMGERKAYPSDLTDEQWAVVAHRVCEPRGDPAPSRTPLTGQRKHVAASRSRGADIATEMSPINPQRSDAKLTQRQSMLGL